MKPLNEKERNEKFGKFIILYFFSLLIIVLNIFFNVESNSKELSVLRNKVKETDIFMGKENLILIKSDSIINNINSLSAKNLSNNFILQNRATKDIGDIIDFGKLISLHRFRLLSHGLHRLILSEFLFRSCFDFLFQHK